ncbi:MAG TPA: hypothetical protein VGM92_06905 [Candidatus Kapabacteria bacterium]|jgi:hypothetical protein
MRRTIFFVLTLLAAAGTSLAQQWEPDLTATQRYMQNHFWNRNTQNFVRRADQPDAPGSDSWGITIVLDADAYLVAEGRMKPAELKQYFVSSSMLYGRTNGNSGARVLARQGDQIYVGGDDDLQWSAALAHCYLVTKDSDYLTAATSSFGALIDMGFWQDGSANGSKGWSWNSDDRRPNGVSTAYGALAAARLYEATRDNVYKQWCTASLNALETPQVGFFPRDRMVAAEAAMTAYHISHEEPFQERALQLEEQATTQALTFLHHDGTGERNPTDIGDLADGLAYFSTVTHDAKYRTLATTFIQFFAAHRTPRDISDHGFYSRYDTKGTPIMTGAYLGVPCSIPFLPEVAEMLKLFAIASPTSTSPTSSNHAAKTKSH